MMEKKLDAIIMAGGKGSRLGIDVEKPLLVFRGRRLIEHALDALQLSRYIKSITVVTSRNTENTEAWARRHGVTFLRAPGSGYVEDMSYALKKLRFGRTIVLSSDMPLISGEDVDYLAEEYFKMGKPAMAVFVPERIFKKYKIKPTMVFDGLATARAKVFAKQERKTCAPAYAVVPAGINVIDGSNLGAEESKLITEKIQFAGNLNSIGDLKRMESIIYKSEARS